MTRFGLVATAALLFVAGCSSDGRSPDRADAGDASSVTIAPEIEGSIEPGVDTGTWRCTTTTEAADAGDDIVACTCSKFAVPVDTTDAPPACAPEPCCIADGPTACDCFSATFPQAMDCDGLVEQTRALEMAQGLPIVAKRVSTCPEQ
ncbi:MAG TPA: hypothetical protein VHU80_20275 [Polyangiaceae bacterium]|jgi:hypothetical protein|nr:hypothetical protein [Polyangiaceae bacterium]